MTTEHIPEHAPDLDATHARQGRRGMHAFIILVVSLALVIVAYVVIYALHVGSLSGTHGAQETAPSAARAFNGPEPAPRVTDQTQSGHSPGPPQSEPSATTPS